MPTNKGRKQQNLANQEDAKANASGQRGSDSDHADSPWTFEHMRGS